MNGSNQLKIGYIKIWGINSSYVTQVNVTYNNKQFTTMNFMSDPYNQVCLKGMLLCHTLILFCKVTTTIIISIFTYIWKVIITYNRYVPEKLRLLNYIVKYKILVVLPSVIKGAMINDVMKSFPFVSQRNYVMCQFRINSKPIQQ